jgi:Dolichyl-phosphate-mannose-protein mannosyltransferase
MAEVDRALQAERAAEAESAARAERPQGDDTAPAARGWFEPRIGTPAGEPPASNSRGPYPGPSPNCDDTRPDLLAERETAVIPVLRRNRATAQYGSATATLPTATTGTDGAAGGEPEAQIVRGRPYLGPAPGCDDTRPDLLAERETAVIPVLRRNRATAQYGSATATLPTATTSTDLPAVAPADAAPPAAATTDADPLIAAPADADPPVAAPAGTAGPSSSPAEAAAPSAAAAAQTPTETPKTERAPQADSAADDRAAAPEVHGWLHSRRRASPADSGGTPRGEPAAKKARGGYFGLAPAVRPDVITDAETIMLPALEKSRANAPSGSAAAARTGRTDLRPSRDAAAAAGPADATQTLPVIAPPAEMAPAPARARARRWGGAKRPSELPERYVTSRHTKRMSRLVLFAILCVQACLSLRLHNTAFEDEAQYLYAGHMELEHILHGSALQGDYTSFFSGSPVLYPVAAAALDQVGGLALARALSLVEMLAVTTMAYSIARYLFNERVGLYAAGLYAVTEPVIFMGNFATYDATCLCLLAFAAWIMVYSSRCRWPVFLLAGPVAALAVAVKYAGLLFVPTIAVLPVLAAWPDRRRRVLLHTLGFLFVVAELLYLALHLGGQSYMTAISSTTTNRAQGTTPDITILKEFAEWGGVVFAVAVIGTIAYVWRVQTEPDEDIAPSGGPLRRAMLGVVLTGSALLAPAYQAHLHTDVSFLKHVGFGLFFAAPMAGFGLARLIGDYVRWPHVGVGIWSLALVLGMMQSGSLYQAWPDSTPFVQTFDGYLKPDARYLVEVPEVPVYYLMGNRDAQPDQFTSTYFITYYNTKGQALTGAAGYAAAVQAGYFQVIAYNGDITQAVDQAIEGALATSKLYYLAAVVPLSDGAGPVNYYIWVKGHRPDGLGLAPLEGKAGRFLLAS